MNEDEEERDEDYNFLKRNDKTPEHKSLVRKLNNEL